MSDLQRITLGAQWAAEAVNPDLDVGVELWINIPDYAAVERNPVTGQVAIREIRLSDLISLRDSIDAQITQIQDQLRERNVWEPL